MELYLPLPTFERLILVFENCIGARGK